MKSAFMCEQGSWVWWISNATKTDKRGEMDEVMERKKERKNVEGSGNLLSMLFV